jgi:hypothetical protein
MKSRSIAKKNETGALVVTARIARQILIIRGQKVMIDADLAALYDVPTKRLNEQVKRNPGRFPADFVFSSVAPSATRWSQFATTSSGSSSPRPCRSHSPSMGR